MNLGDAVNSVSIKLGKRDHLKEDGTILNQLLQTQEALEQESFLPWFLISLQTTTQTLSETSSVPPPTGFIREADGGWMQLQDSSGIYRRLPRRDYDVLFDIYGEAASAIPEAYALLGGAFYFFPTPDDKYKLKFFAYMKDTSITSLSNESENLWLTNASNLLVTRTARTLATKLQNPRLAGILFQEEKQAAFELQAAHAAREVSGHYQTMRDIR